jgi:hypothetical protein
MVRWSRAILGPASVGTNDRLIYAARAFHQAWGSKRVT